MTVRQLHEAELAQAAERLARAQSMAPSAQRPVPCKVADGRANDAGWGEF